ncbi:MAG: hypothetical protein D6805_00145 [Planctomycetota bacterium]|nr:MAG: hypothetical protein D6805_00145 [Planctomycetota bacterium]
MTLPHSFLFFLLLTTIPFLNSCSTSKPASTPRPSRQNIKQKQLYTLRKIHQKAQKIQKEIKKKLTSVAKVEVNCTKKQIFIWIKLLPPKQRLSLNDKKHLVLILHSYGYTPQNAHVFSQPQTQNSTIHKKTSSNSTLPNSTPEKKK